MTLIVKPLERVFKFTPDGAKKELTLTDPGITLTPKEVLDHYANMYPEITNAKITGPILEKEQYVYKINTEKGQHG